MTPEQLIARAVPGLTKVRNVRWPFGPSQEDRDILDGTIAALQSADGYGLASVIAKYVPSRAQAVESANIDGSVAAFFHEVGSGSISVCVCDVADENDRGTQFEIDAATAVTLDGKATDSLKEVAAYLLGGPCRVKAELAKRPGLSVTKAEFTRAA